MLLPQVLSLLDNHKIRYESCALGSSHDLRDIERIVAEFGMGWVEGILLEIEGKCPAMAVIPTCLTIDGLTLSTHFSPCHVRPFTPEEIEQIQPGASPGYIPPLGELFGAEVYLSPLVEKYHRVGFFVDSSRTYVTLEAAEFRRLLAHASDFPATRAKYRAYASPFRKPLDSCILGISLENADFHTSKLVTITKWIRKRFTNCVVMVGDSLHRINLQLDAGLPESAALEQAQWLGRNFVHSQHSVFFGDEPDQFFRFVYCSDIQQSQEYAGYYQSIVALHRDNPGFKEAFYQFAEFFVKRRSPQPEMAERDVEMSCRYLMEELAIISCLAQESTRTFVYPGSLTILDEIASGKHPDVPSGLLEMDYVELKLKRH